jgi:hypothetical protein
MAVSHVSRLLLDVSKIVVDMRLDFIIMAPMTDDFYKKAFDSAVDELSSLTTRHSNLLKEAATLEERIEKVRQGALGLATLADIDFQQIKDKYPKLFEDQIDPRMGITDAVREALRMNGGLMTPTDVREGVFRISPAIAGHKNPMASIHAILRRLVDSDEVLIGTDKEKRTVYVWAGTDEALEHATTLFKKTEQMDEIIARIKAERAKKNKG